MRRFFTAKKIDRWDKYRLLVTLLIGWLGQFPISEANLHAQTLPVRDSLGAASFQEKYQKTMQRASQRGWPLRLPLGTTRTLTLLRTDALGQPVYYTTHSSPLSAGTRTDALYQGGTLGVALNGSSDAVKSKIALWDGGKIRADHRELSGKIRQNDATPGAPSDHATHMAGILVARGVEKQVRGLAFGAELQAWDFDNDLSEIIQQAPRLLLSNHAYGPVAGWLLDTSRPGTSNDEKWEWWGTPAIDQTQDYRFGFYDEAVSEIDRITYNFPYFLMVRSADNKRTENGPPSGTRYYLKNTNTQSTLPRSRNDSYDIIPGEANAKNVLTVGAAEPNATTFAVAPYSGWGPTDDGRIKPDLLGIGSQVLSSVGTDTDAYGIFSGTSMASASVSGALLLLQELYQQQRGSYMLSATLKGLALHAADKPDGLATPDYTYGWGLLNTEKAARVILNQTGNHLLTEKVLRQGDTFTQKILASGNGPLVVTICWTDPEAPATEVSSRNVNNTSPKLINDLDIVLQEGFNTYRPWVLDPAAPAQKARTGDNIRDNVEQVYIANALKGRSYTLTISHKRTLRNGQQPFALIISGMDKPACEQAAVLSPGPDTTLCVGQVLTLAANAGNNFTYEWFRNGSSIRKGPERFLEVSQAASYTVRVTAPGCEAVSAPVTVRSSPLFADIAQKGKLLVCDSKGVALSANTGIDYTYQWLLNGNILPDATQPQHQATQTGLYQVRISYRGCTALSPVTQVEVTPVLASLNPADRAAICNGAPATLNAPQQSGFAYSWYYNGALIAGASKASYPAVNPGRYAVEVRNGSCQVRSSEVVVQRVNVTATLTPPPTTLIPPGSSLPLKASYAIGNRYAWYRNDSLMPQEIAPLFNATRGGTYRVEIENSGCRVSTEPVTLWGGQDADPLLTDNSLPPDSLSFLTLYPNPAQETLILTVRPSTGGTDLRADLLNIRGQTLASQPLLPERGYLRSQFDLRTLPPGPYLIKIKAGGRSDTRHFIKR
jgi:hypothetical protein